MGSILVIVALLFLVCYFGVESIICILYTSVLAVIACEIDAETTYTWYYGLWHGIFFVPNFLLYLVSDVPFKAELYSTAYNVFYWIFSILSSITLFRYMYIGRRPD